MRQRPTSGHPVRAQRRSHRRSLRWGLVLAILIGLGVAAQPAEANRPAARADRGRAKGKRVQARNHVETRPGRQDAQRPLRGATRAQSPQQAVARTKRHAKAYADKHGFTARTVKVGLKGEEIERVFVPITPETLDSFYGQFALSSGKGSVILRYTEANKHLMMAVEPDDIYLWGQNKNIGNAGNSVYRNLYHTKDGNRSEWNGASFVVHPTSPEALTRFLAEKAEGPQCEGHCMQWLPNAPAGDNGLTLFHDLGVTRSMDGANMRNKIMHAGNHRVGVVGIHVQSVEDFKNLSDEALVGALPTNGLEGARSR